MLTDFSEALKALKLGKRITRKNWKNKFTYVFFVGSEDYSLKGYVAEEVGVVGDTYGAMLMLAQNSYVLPWHPTTDDIISEDWLIL